MVEKIDRTIVDENDVVERRTIVKYHSPLAGLVWGIASILNTLLAVRFVLQMVGSSRASDFTNFIYTLTDPFVQPFAGTIARTSTGLGTADWSVLVAMAIYWLAAWLIVWMTTTPRALTHS